MKASDFTKEVWLYLLNEGGYWTARQLATNLKVDIDKILDALHGMERRNLVKKQHGIESRRLIYGIDGTCLVPCGLAVAEVQI